MYRIALEQYPFSAGERTMKTRFIPQTRLTKQCLANSRKLRLQKLLEEQMSN